MFSISIGASTLCAIFLGSRVQAPGTAVQPVQQRFSCMVSRIALPQVSQDWTALHQPCVVLVPPSAVQGSTKTIHGLRGMCRCKLAS